MSSSNSEREKIPMAVPWYKADQWSRWKEISQDKICETYEIWLEGAERALKRLTKKGIEVHRIEIDIEEFSRWSGEKGLQFDGYARAEYAALKLSKRLLRFHLPAENLPSQKEIQSRLKGHDFSGIWEPYLRRPEAAVCPIVRDKCTGPEQFGSGVLIRIGNVHFILTAAHVADEMERHSVMIPYKDGFGGLVGAVAGTRMPHTGNRKDDRYDVCYIRLDPDVANSIHDDLLFLEAEDCDPFDVTNSQDVYTMIGFPASKSKTDEGMVSTAQFSLSGDGVDDKRYELLNCERSSHILVQHRRGKAVNHSTMRRSQPPHPAGMSGGGMFAWDKALPKLSALSQPKLAGIITEYHPQQNVFVATRLHLFLLAIHRNNPDLPSPRHWISTDLSGS